MAVLEWFKSGSAKYRVSDVTSATRFAGPLPVQHIGIGNGGVGNNVDATLLASSARTITTPSPDQTNSSGRGVIVVLDMSVVGTGSVTLSIQGKDSVSGNYYNLLTGAAVTTNSTNVYIVYPGVTVAANASVSSVLPRTWRVNVVANNANSATYSVSASVIV